ncbi:hypothetical protein V1477_003840 [Vespula maculifrons]|uniref:Uncharacterized protein n=1 Tax=Vespula maculifrons TaxID=7453 RepID=A0ABD2CS53_VESMC
MEVRKLIYRVVDVKYFRVLIKQDICLSIHSLNSVGAVPARTNEASLKMYQYISLSANAADSHEKRILPSCNVTPARREICFHVGPRCQGFTYNNSITAMTVHWKSELAYDSFQSGHNVDNDAAADDDDDDDDDDDEDDDGVRKMGCENLCQIFPQS